jgi:DNA-directed RNA polymerase specialized sigma24 family protein
VGRVIDTAEVSRFRSGDPDAVRAVYREYGKLVYAVAYKALGDRGLAEEATQQAFVQAWRASSTYDPTRDLGPWLATIARRAALTHAEISERLGIPLGTVKSRSFRAHRRLAGLLGHLRGDPEGTNPEEPT